MELNEPRRDALAFLRVSYESHESHWVSHWVSCEGWMESLSCDCRPSVTSSS